MTVPDPGRRRILGLLAGLTGFTAIAGVLRWLDLRGDGGEAADEAPPPPTQATTSTTEATTTATPTTTTSSTTTTEAATTTTVPIVTVSVLCREAWRASAPRDGMEPHTVQRLTVHHSAVPIDTPSEGPAQILAHQAYHQNTQGWPDIAYHFLIDPGGNIYQGRDPSLRGDTGTDYDPTGHFLVCVDGDFDTTEPNDAQIGALVDILAYGAITFRIEPSTLGGHRDYTATSCPGQNLYRPIEDGTLEARLRQRLTGGSPALNLICGQEGASVVADIESAI